MPPIGRDQASLSFGALAIVRLDVLARDWRTGLLPHVVQPAPGTCLAEAGAGAASVTAASASTTAARVRVVFRERPGTATTIARRSFPRCGGR